MNISRYLVIAALVVSGGILVWFFLFGHADNHQTEMATSSAFLTPSAQDAIFNTTASGALPFNERVIENSKNVITKSEQIDYLMSTGHPADVFSAFKLAAYCLRSRNSLRDLVTTEEDVKKVCGNITEYQIASRGKYLDVALQAKIHGAATEFLLEGPIGGDVSALDTRPTDPLIIEWKHQAINVFIAASKYGDVDSLNQLSTIYQMGTLAEKDMELALTYEIARQEVLKVQDKFSPGQSTSGAQLIFVLARDLSPEQIISATNSGKKMANDCCKKLLKESLIK